jgi:hypothetical protein
MRGVGGVVLIAYKLYIMSNDFKHLLRIQSKAEGVK